MSYISEVLNIVKIFTHINLIVLLVSIFFTCITEEQKEAQKSSVYNC